MSWFQWQGDDLILHCRIQPNASADEIVGVQPDANGESVKIRITAPPVDGKANQYLIQFVAKAFSVSKRDIMIEKGQSGRQKRIRIRAPGQIPAKLCMIKV